jgi:endo-1,4-beta-mannosidase
MNRLRNGPHFLRDGERSVAPVGVHLVPRQGPDWPWRVGVEEFERAFSQIAALGLDSVRVDLLWAAVEPREGCYDERHLQQVDLILEAARRHGLRLHPVLLVGGEVGDAVWDVPWRVDANPHADPELRRRQADHARALAERWGGDSAVLAWDLTDEPPIWLFQDTSDDDARAWTRELASAIREAAPGDLITIGTASQEVDHGPFRADVVAPELDFACVHPYPIYSPELYPDRLLASRMTHAGAFEVALAAGAGRPVMLHEYGASSTQFDPEAIAAYDRLLAWSSFGRGAIGFYPWCWIDAEPSAYRRAPYVRMPHETQFGLLSADGEPRPRAAVHTELAAKLARIDLDAYASAGPLASAACLVPHEYVAPYDAAAYGLDAEPAGPYVPAEAAWSPQRDVKPLVRAWLNSFVLASRAGVSVRFPRERLDDVWPDADLLLLPAPLTTTSCSLWHVRTSFWQGAGAFLARGATAYLSLSADSAIPELEQLAGCRIVERAPAQAGERLRFLTSWGPFAPGDELALPQGNDRLHGRGVALELAGAEAIAVDAAGNPALVSFASGGGHAVACAQPLELLLADVADAHGPSDRSWGVYAGLLELAGVAEEARVEHPELTCGSLRGERGGLLVVTNHGPSALAAPLHLPAGAQRVTEVRAEQLVPHSTTEVQIGAHEALVLTWER